MELASSLEPLLCPTAAFADAKQHAHLQSLQSRYDEERNHNRSALVWDSSCLNPSKRIDSQDGKRLWRIDGCTGQGRQFFATPVHIIPGGPPRRIDVFIPCQSKHPPALRSSLKSSLAVKAIGQHIGHVPLTDYVLYVLSHWSTHQKYFVELYSHMPFGSRLVIENIDPVISNVRVRFLPADGSYRRFRSQSELAQMWIPERFRWPPSISLESLELLKQLHDTVSVVSIPKMHGKKQLVFKSSLRHTRNLYHELRLLLTMPQHPRVISSPFYLVTLSEQNDKVIGFILDYFTAGTLGQTLDRWHLSGSQKPHLQFQWAEQLVTTLQDLQKTGAGYYSDLKMDNLLLTRTDGDLIFIDFEQAGNWDTFSAPEVFYIIQLSKLATEELVPEGKRAQYARLLAQLGVKKDDPSGDDNQYRILWRSMSPSQQEAAMVYTVGKVLWCIFERCSHTRNELDESYATAAPVEFPEFLSTPLEMRPLITMCTLGSQDKAEEMPSIMREGSTVFPRRPSDRKPDKTASPMETSDAAKMMWIRRVGEMEQYLEAFIRWRNGQTIQGDEAVLGFGLRPPLTEVLNAILDAKQRYFRSASVCDKA